MSIQAVKSVVKQFLSSETPEVLAIKGQWGTGKTYLWRQLIKENAKNIRLKNYCYVSLFGITSISELRTAVFTKIRPIELIEKEFDFEAFNKDYLKYSGLGVRMLFGRIQKLREAPIFKNFSISIESVASYFISDTIVCFDDFERLIEIKSDHILGFISELKEEKRCKIVIIFNEDHIDDKATYNKYREKVIDKEILFSPTNEESFDLGISANNPNRTQIKNYTSILGITNIRILRKIDMLSELLNEPSSRFRPELREQLIKSLVLVAWCYYESIEISPDLDSLFNWNALVSAMKKRNGEKDDSDYFKWEKILDEYGYYHASNFDKVISKVLKNGHLEETGLTELLKKENDLVIHSDLQKNFYSAWGLFAKSFTRTQQDVVMAICNAAKLFIGGISPGDLNQTIILLRELGENECADDLLEYFISHREIDPGLFNIENLESFVPKIDPLLRSRFNEKFREKNNPISFKEAVLNLANGNRWYRNELEILKNASEDDFYRLFKECQGESLNSIIKYCIRFNDSDEKGSQVSILASNALKKIAGESLINKLRVKQFGVDLD